MKIGKGPVATRKPDLLWLKLAKEGSETLLVTSVFPKWIISDKRLPAPSRNGSSRISNCQSLLRTRISCSSMFLLLRIKVSTGRSRGKFLVSFIKTKKKLAGTVHCNTNWKQVSIKSKRKLQRQNAKSNSLGEAVYIRSSGALVKQRIASLARWWWTSLA